MSHIIELIGKIPIPPETMLKGNNITELQANYRTFVFRFLAHLRLFDPILQTLLHNPKADWNVKNIKTRSSTENKDEDLNINQLDSALFNLLTRCLPNSLIISKANFQNINVDMEKHGYAYTLWKDLSQKLENISVADQIHLASQFITLKQISGTVESFATYTDTFQIALLDLQRKYAIALPDSFVSAIFLGNLHPSMDMAVTAIMLSVDKLKLEIIIPYIANFLSKREIQKLPLSSSKPSSSPLSSWSEGHQAPAIAVPAVITTPAHKEGKEHKEACRNFKRGHCKFGAQCKYSHQPTDQAQLVETAEISFTG